MYFTVNRWLWGFAGLLQPALERLAIEALQLCTLLLPPVFRRKLQLLLRMVSRMSQNVDMPQLHDTIGTRTLVRVNSVLSTLTLVKCLIIFMHFTKEQFHRLRLFTSPLILLFCLPLCLCVNADGANVLPLCVELRGGSRSGWALGHQAAVLLNGPSSRGTPGTHVPA